MRVKALGICRRQLCPTDGSLKAADQIQVGNISGSAGFGKTHSNDIFQKQALPILRFTPQPAHLARQWGVVSEACAVWFSRTKKDFSTR